MRSFRPSSLAVLILPPALAIALLSLARGQAPGTTGPETATLSLRVGSESSVPARVLFAGSQACVLLPPEMIAAPLVRSVSYAPAGRYALVQRRSVQVTPEAVIAAAGAGQTPLPGLTSLVFWDSRTRVAREVWRADDPDAEPEVRWIPQTSTALIQVNETVPGDRRSEPGARLVRQRILRVAGGPAEVIAQVGQDRNLSLTVSPALPLAIVETSLRAGSPAATDSAPAAPDRHHTLAILDARGQTITSTVLPPDLANGIVGWDERASPYLVAIQPDPTTGRRKPRWYAIDPRTAGLRLLESRPGPSPEMPDFSIAPFGNGPANRPGLGPRPPSSTSLRVQQTATSLGEGASARRIDSLWLESAVRSSQPRALLCADCQGGGLLPGGDAVVYLSQGAAWAVPLLKLSSTQYAAIQTAAQQTLIAGRARQVGVAIASYSQDWDEHYPIGDVKPALNSYVKSNSVLQGFVFTGKPGIPLAAIEDPAATEIGYIPGPNGRAVLYADMHVKWEIGR